jgi:hypothetical protein
VTWSSGYRRALLKSPASLLLGLTKGFWGAAVGIIRTVGVLSLLLGASEASAEVVFLSETNTAGANASASAGGYAFAFGDEARAKTGFRAHANFNASSVNNGTGGSFSYGVGSATGRFVGSTRSVDSVTEAPIITTSVDTKTKSHGDYTTITTTTTTTTETTTTTTTTEAFEALTATASDFEDMTSQFVSPSQAIFSFSGYASAAFGGIAYTRILTEPVTTSTVVTDTKITKITPEGATTTENTKTTSKVSRGPTMATTTAGSDWFPNNFVTGYAAAQAFSNDTSTYTFDVPGAESITLRYDAQGPFGASVSYQIEVMNDATSVLVGAADRLNANADGDVTWGLASPGVYSLIIAANSEIGASENFSGLAGADPGRSKGVFEMSVSSVPELSTWEMLLLGFFSLGSVAFQRASGVGRLARPDVAFRRLSLSLSVAVAKIPPASRGQKRAPAAEVGSRGRSRRLDRLCREMGSGPAELVAPYSRSSGIE